MRTLFLRTVFQRTVFQRTAFNRLFVGAEIVNVTIKSGGRADGIVALNASVLIHQTSIDVGGINIAGQTEYGDTSRLFMGISESTLHSGNGMVFNVTDGIAANISGYNVKFKGKKHHVGQRALGYCPFRTITNISLQSTKRRMSSSNESCVPQGNITFTNLI